MSGSREKTLRAVETGPGLLVHPTADQRLATERWLLSTLPKEKHARARAEWAHSGLAMLDLGGMFSVVRLPATLLLALIGGRSPSGEVDRFLDQELEGPVICDPRYERYYALVPPDMPVTWRGAVDEWRVADDVDCLGHGCSLGVPKVDAITYDRKRPLLSYWSVPATSGARLCQPLTVARLIAAGRHQMPAEAGA